MQLGFTLNLVSQFKKSWKAIIAVAGLSGILILLGGLISDWLGTPVRDLYRDPVAVLDGDFSIGFLSQAGGLMWIAAATILLFSSRVLKGQGKSPEDTAYLFLAGMISLLLGLDDVFLLHESVIPYLTGLRENHIYGIYSVVLMGIAQKHFRKIQETEIILLGIAIAFLAGSTVMDFFNIKSMWLHVAEDIFKLVGIVSWLIYAWRTSQENVMMLISSREM